MKTFKAVSADRYRLKPDSLVLKAGQKSFVDISLLLSGIRSKGEISDFLLIKSDMFEARVPIKIKITREPSIGKNQATGPSPKTEVRNSSQEPNRPSSASKPQANYFSNNTGNSIVTSSTGDLKQKVVELTRENEKLRNRVQDDSLESKVMLIINQHKPNIADLVEIALKDEKAKVREKYELMMDMLEEREKELSVHNGSCNGEDLGQNPEIRNYVRKLEDKIKELERELSEKKSEILKMERKLDDAITHIDQSSSKLPPSLVKDGAGKMRKLEAELEKKNEELEVTKELATDVLISLESAFKGKLLVIYSLSVKCAANAQQAVQATLRSHSFKSSTRIKAKKEPIP